MLISAKKLIGLRVETKTARHLGRVRDFDIDADTLEIRKIYIRPAGIVKGLTDGDLIVAKSAVLSVDENKMTVEDLAAGELAEESASQRVAVKSSPIAASIREDC